MNKQLFTKMTASTLLKSQSGQAVVEYILVLVVSMAIIFGVIYQLNSAFQVWANNYFGNYLACLIETGELPALGGDDTVSELCNEQFQAFSLANGRPSQSASRPGSGSTSNNSTSSSSRPSGATRGSSKSGSGGGASHVAAGRTGRFRKGSGGRGKGSGGGTVNTFAKGSDSDGVTIIKVSKINNGSNGGSVEEEQSGRINYGSFSKDETESNRISLKGKNKETSEKRKESERLKIRKPAKKTAIEEDEAWDFGDWFRILIIAAIIIALVVFLAGQLLQISKSMD